MNEQLKSAAMDEIERQQREDRQRIRSDAEALTALMAHGGWKVYMRLVEAVAQNYHGAIMKPIDSALESVKVEFAKGVLSGLSLATSLPTMKVTEAKSLSPAGDDE